MHQVRYCKDAPSTIRRWIDRNEEKVQEFDSGYGYATDSGFAYDVLLRPGWRMGDDHVHTLIEPTVAALLAQLRSVRPCDCEDCAEMLRRQERVRAQVPR